MQHPIVHVPFKFNIGPLPLTGFGFAMMAAFGVAHWVSQQVLVQRGDDPEIMHDVTFAALVGTIAGTMATGVRPTRVALTVVTAEKEFFEPGRARNAGYLIPQVVLI